MAAKAFDLLSDSFPAHRNSAFSEQIFNISSDECKAMVVPDSIGGDLARKTKTLQARHFFGRYSHARGLTNSEPANKLAMPCQQIGYPVTIRVDNSSEFISRDMD